MKNYIRQYEFLFIFPWFLCYLIFPSWALPVSLYARASVFFGLIIFLFISANTMSRWFNKLSVDKPVIAHNINWVKHIKSNAGLFILCCIAVILHIRSLFYPILIMGDEALHLQGGLWIYNYIDVRWHIFFQIIFWGSIGLILLIKKFRKESDLSNMSKNKLMVNKADNSLKLIRLFFIVGFFAVYFLLLRDIPFFPSSIRYPPVSRFLYFIMYSAFGITQVGPRMLELIFYSFSAVYLYKTVSLFHDRTSAIISALIYLFLPVVFTYAKFAELACGTVFFIILISYYFIRFIKNGDDRDLLLTSYFIGIGFLYKEPIFLMFFVCFVFLIAYKIKNPDLVSILHFKVILLSLMFIIPWMIIEKIFSWRYYKIVWSNFRPFEGKIFSYFLQIPADISWLLFVFFLFSIIFILFAKKNILSYYFGVLFVAYYFFYAMDLAHISPRLSMAFYPTIAVFIAQFINDIISKIRWKYSFKLFCAVLTVYLIVICTVPPLNAQFLSSLEFRKLQYFPAETAMKWVKDNVKDSEKILTLRIMSTLFYTDKYNIDRNKIVDFWYELDEVSTPEKLKTFYRNNKISYLMFPGYLYHGDDNLKILQYLIENKDSEFIEIARFNRDKNNIYIYKLKDDIIH